MVDKRFLSFRCAKRRIASFSTEYADCSYLSATTSFAEWLRQLIGMTNERLPATTLTSARSPCTTLGTEITNSRPKSRRALPEIVLATSPTRSHMFSWLKSFSCIFMSSTVSMARGAVK